MLRIRKIRRPESVIGAKKVKSVIVSSLGFMV